MFLAIILYFFFFSSSLALIASSYDCRVSYSLLQNLESEEWSLRENHSRLLLEHSTWASYDRVETNAREKLLMKSPTLGNLVLVLK